MLKEALKELKFKKKARVKFYRIDEAFMGQPKRTTPVEQKQTMVSWALKVIKDNADKGDKEARKLLDKFYNENITSAKKQVPYVLDYFEKLEKRKSVNDTYRASSVKAKQNLRKKLNNTESVKHAPRLVDAAKTAANHIVVDTIGFLKNMWNDPKSDVQKEFESFDVFVKDGLQDHTEQAYEEFCEMLHKAITDTVKKNLNR